jgi:tetratricopeptide (TPR) repeat protein
MQKVLEERFVEKTFRPTAARNGTDAVTTSGRDEVEQPGNEADRDSLLDLLVRLERPSGAEDSSRVVAAYRGWIQRNSKASPALFAAWFNLGVELSTAGDKAGAINAYRSALELRPDFHPAAVNLGVLLESVGQPEAALAVWQQALQPDEARAMLLDHRALLAEACRGKGAADVLHVGCGDYAREKLPPIFRHAGWREVRLDIDQAVKPDLVASMTDMRVVADGDFEAVYSSHNIEHLYPHEVPVALQEMRRVLKPSGFLLITLPDVQEVARHIAEGKLDDPLYMSAMGPIAPLDILFGHRPSLASGNLFMAHRTGFTSGTLAAALIGAGFAAALVQRNPAGYCLTAVAFRSPPNDEQLAMAQAQILQASDLPAVLYTLNGRGNPAA